MNIYTYKHLPYLSPISYPLCLSNYYNHVLVYVSTIHMHMCEML